MGSCAFLMPVSSARFVKKEAYALRPALALAIGGIPAVFIAALIVKDMDLQYRALAGGRRGADRGDDDAEVGGEGRINATSEKVKAVPSAEVRSLKSASKLREQAYPRSFVTVATRLIATM